MDHVTIFHKLRLNDVLKVWVKRRREINIRYYRVVSLQETPIVIKMLSSTDQETLLLSANSILFNHSRWYPKMKILEGKEKEVVKTLYF